MVTWYEQWQDAKNKDWSDTQLSAKEEKEFKQWLTDLPWFKQIENRVEDKQSLFEDIAGQGADYAYRTAWKNGVNPSIYQYDGTYHWPSATDTGETLKSPDHPTLWMEYFMRDSGIDPNQFGLETPENARTWLNQYNSVNNAFTW